MGLIGSPAIITNKTPAYTDDKLLNESTLGIQFDVSKSIGKKSELGITVNGGFNNVKFKPDASTISSYVSKFYFFDVGLRFYYGLFKNGHLITGLDRIYYNTKEDNDPRKSFRMQQFTLPYRTALNIGFEHRQKLLGKGARVGVLFETLLGLENEIFSFSTISNRGYLKPKVYLTFTL
jgi:hypothetical protein